jgi:hypothetical protein
MPNLIRPRVRSIACGPSRQRAAHPRSAQRADQNLRQEQTSSEGRDGALAGLDDERSQNAAASKPSVLLSRYLIPVATATVFVAVFPVLIVWRLRASGVVGSPVLGMLLGMALSLGACRLGGAVWERRRRIGSEDVLFSELMIWGFLHRWRSDRRLDSARELLGSMNQAQRRVSDGLSRERQVKLLEQLAAGMDARDPSTHGHSRRVARHSWMIAKRMGLPREQVARIRTAAAVHDVGKIETPLPILHKAGRLTDEEYEVIKRHPADGARMAEVLHDPELTSMVLDHHERLDGSGYPNGLSGGEIPLGARIIAVADTFDAMTSVRPYRPAYPHKKAIDILRSEADTRLDPAVVRAFCGHNSGRRSVVIWASVTSLPERVIAWLGGSLAGVASVAKVMVVAALVGGTAATTSMLGSPLVKRHAHPASTAGLHAQPVPSVTKSASVSTSSAGTPRSRRAERVRPAVVNPSVHNGSPAQQPGTNPSAGGTVGAQPSRSANPGTGSGSGTEPGKSEPPVKSEPPAKGKGEPPVKSEPPAKGKGEPPVKSEPPAKGKGEPPVKSEPPAKGEVPGKGNGEPPVKSEPPAKGKGAGKP